MIQRQTGETISSNFAVHFYLSLRQKIAFLRILPYTFALFYRRNSPFFIFHRTFALFSTAEFYLSSFLIVHLRLSLRRNFTFSISLPYTCAISFGGISPFFIFHRIFAPFSTAEFHFFHFPAVHLLSFLRRNFAFLHFPPYTSILSCRRISPSMAFSPKSLQKILPRHFLPYCHIKNYFLRQLFSTSNPGKFTPASYLTPGKLSSQRLPAPPGR